MHVSVYALERVCDKGTGGYVPLIIGHRPGNKWLVTATARPLRVTNEGKLQSARLEACHWVS